MNPNKRARVQLPPPPPPPPPISYVPPELMQYIFSFLAPPPNPYRLPENIHRIYSGVRGVNRSFRANLAALHASNAAPPLTLDLRLDNQFLATFFLSIQRTKLIYPHARVIVHMNRNDVTNDVLEDLVSIGGIRDAVISSENVTDVSAFRNANFIKLTNCNGVTDVSVLRNVPSLWFESCHNIRDVSALGHVDNVRIEDCRGITDVSALGTVQSLTLAFCRGITDVRALAHVPRLNLTLSANLDYSAVEGRPGVRITRR